MWEPYFNVSSCTQDTSLDDNTPSAVCTIPIRRLNFMSPAPFNELKGQTMKIALTTDVPTPVGDADDVVWTS